jgi:hypothetical protein
MKSSLPTLCLRRLAAPACLLALLLAGCQSPTGPGAGSFAHVVIKGHSLAEVQAKTDEVFRADGYVGGRAGPTQFRYFKNASRTTQLAYGGILYPDGNISYRVEVTSRDLDAGSVLLQCQVYRVRSNGDPFFDDNTNMRGIRSGPYQMLLNKVKRQLK